MSELFSPLVLRSLTFANRAWISPMCQYSSVEGEPNDWHLAHLGSFARGGAGLVMTEASAVVPEGRTTPADAGIWNDEQAAGWARLVEFVHRQDVPIGMQLGHAGRKASTEALWGSRRTLTEAEGGWQTVAPSAVAFPGQSDPRELRADEMNGIVSAFATAARRAVDAGFDVVEVHAAHGYLLHQFLSPLSNTRDDEYGGSLANRSRLVRQVATAVRAVIPDGMPLFVRVSATDWIEHGWDETGTVQLARWLRDDGVDLLDVSTGGSGPAQIPLGPAYQARFAATVRAQAKMPTSAVGLIDDARLADQLITSGQCDAVMIGRGALRQPHWPLLAASELQVTDGARWPRQYFMAAPRPRSA